MSEVSDIIAAAHARAEARPDPRVDYDALNKMVRRQRAALTRAKNSDDPEKVVLACRNAVQEWDAPGAMWPDDWATWQCALDDALGFRASVDLRDLV